MALARRLLLGGGLLGGALRGLGHVGQVKEQVEAFDQGGGNGHGGHAVHRFLWAEAGRNVHDGTSKSSQRQRGGATAVTSEFVRATDKETLFLSLSNTSQTHENTLKH